MLLFLDVISPIPEIFLIEDNKVVLKRKIIQNESEKLSDHIFETYVSINKDINLSEKLKKVAMTVGPGSYTSLRVGAAFISGIKISKKLLFCPISIYDILTFKTNKLNKSKSGIFLCSGNNQRFLCSINKYNKVDYKKIESDKNITSNQLNKIFYNFKKLETDDKKLKQYKFSIIKEIIANVDRLVFTNNNIIQPIYISNNKILN